MTSRLVLLLVALLTSEMTQSVILRPRWFPYFRRPSQVNSASSNLGGSSGTAVGVSETLGARQTRNSLGDLQPQCHDSLNYKQCLHRVLSVVNWLWRRSHVIGGDIGLDSRVDRPMDYV